MNKKHLKSLLHDLEIKKEKMEEDHRQKRDDMCELQGSIGEIQLMIWKLEEILTRGNKHE